MPRSAWVLAALLLENSPLSSISSNCSVWGFHCAMACRGSWMRPSAFLCARCRLHSAWYLVRVPLRSWTLNSKHTLHSPVPRVITCWTLVSSLLVLRALSGRRGVLPKSARWTASRIVDFPAPVSPAMSRIFDTLNRRSKSTVWVPRREFKFWICRVCSLMLRPLLLRPPLGRISGRRYLAAPLLERSFGRAFEKSRVASFGAHRAAVLLADQ